MGSIGGVLIDGSEVPAGAASVSVFDIGFQRGYGCFEAMRSYGGTVFRLEEHVTRLQSSAGLMGLPLPAAEVLAGWVRDRALLGGDCTVRVLVSGGTELLNPGSGTVVTVYAEPLYPVAAVQRLLPMEAPWHPAGTASQLTGAKTLSYDPNLAVSLAARRAGYNDALLIGQDDTVLEGPTYSVAWVTGNVLETPALSLGILDSITRRVLLELAPAVGLQIAEGVYGLDRVLAADEVLVLSTLKEIRGVAAVGDRVWESTRWSSLLGAAFRELVAAETGAD
jgi:branched-chain amino acid aminotransferase